MSTANAAATTYPYTPQERAFVLYCEGLRSPAIGKQLGVSERTVRGWLAAAREQLTKERAGTAQAAAALSEARQLQIAAAAWDGYRRVAAAEQLQLEELQYGTHEELATHPPRPAAAGARYLALALRATDLAAKLSGAYTCPPPQPTVAELRILMPRPSPQDYDPPSGPYVTPLTGLALEQYQYQEWVDGLRVQIESDQERIAKGRARLAELNALLASQPTTGDDLDDEDADDDVDEVTAAIPAESATALPADLAIPAESAPSAHTGDSEIPAETATASGSPLPRGEGPGVRFPLQGAWLTKAPMAGDNRGERDGT